MNKLFIIGLPRTGTTSISVALLAYFKVAHTAYTIKAFEVADVISDCPCFSDYQQLDRLFPGSKFVYLSRSMTQWLPSITMLLNKMLPSFNRDTYVNPILQRSFNQTFALTGTASPLEARHLINCYQKHKQAVNTYFSGKDNLLTIDISENDSLEKLLTFLGLPYNDNEQFPWLNIGKRVDHWKEIKQTNKVNSNVAGQQGRKFFDY